MSGQGDLKSYLKRTAEGDRAAFRLLYQFTAAKLYAVIRRILQRNEIAEEALQETYVRIWQNAGTYDPQVASPIAWMATIARNQAIDTRRRAGERVAQLSEGGEELLLNLPAESDANSSEDRRIQFLRLKACLERLSADRRELVLLAYYQGYSREELAQRAAKPAATIKSVLRRSLILLKECLDG